MFWSLYFGKPILEAALLPIRVSSNVSIGQADLLTILRVFDASRAWYYGAPLGILALIVVAQRLWLPLEDPLYSLVRFIL